MPDDLASLGLSIDTKSVEEANRQLEKLPATARAAEQSTRSLAAAHQSLSSSAATVADAAEKVVVSTRRMTQYDDAAVAAYRKGRMEIEAAAEAKAAAVVASEEKMAAALKASLLGFMTQQNAAREASAAIAQQYRSQNAAAQQYATDMARTVEKMKISESYTNSLKAAQQYQASFAAGTKAMADELSAAGVQAHFLGTVIDAVGKAQAKLSAGGLGGTGGAGGAATPAAAGLTAQQRLYLGYQLNDVFTQLAMGQNPLMIAAQQGPQITQIFGGLKATLARIPTPALVGGGAAVGAAAYAYALHSINEMNDALQQQQHRLASLVGPQDQAAGAYKDIAKFASDAGIHVSDATEKFIAFGRASQAIGATRQNMLDLASTATKLTEMSGANKAEGGSAQGALAAMLKESTVNAQHLDTVLENVPQIAQRIAAGLGVSVTQLRLLATTGDLTNKQVFEGLLKQTGAVNAEFAKTPKTLGQTFTTMGDDLLQLAQRFANYLPLVKEYRLAIEGIAAGARLLNQATTPSTPAEQMIGGPSTITRSAGFFGQPTVGETSGASRFYSAQFQLGIDDNARTFADMQAAAKAANDNVVQAAALAQKLDPVAQQLKDLQKQAEIVREAISDILAGKTELRGADAVARVDELTEAARRLETAMRTAGDAGDQALRAIGTRADQDRRNLTPGQRDLENRVQGLVDQNVPPDRASSIANAQGLQNARDLVKALEDEAKAEELSTAAHRGGRQAMMEAAVAAQFLAWQMKNVGASTEEAEVAFDVLAQRAQDAMRKIGQNQLAQQTIDASKPLIAQLAGISAAFDKVTEGAYAMRKAEAEAAAAHNDSGTGGLQLQIFDWRQALTDATALENLKKETDLTVKLAAAAGNVAQQKKIQLEYDIKKAQLDASPPARPMLDEAMRAKFAADQAKSVADDAASAERQLQVTKQETALINAGADGYVRQLAMLDKKNELLSKGVDIEKDANAQRQVALAGDQAVANQRKQQAQDAADANKRIWMTAFDNIQSAGADTFFNLFSGVEVKASDVATTFKNVFLRAFAEIAAAAIIRPLVAPIFQAGAAAGLIPSGAVPAATGVTGGGFSLPGIPGLGGLFSGSGSGTGFLSGVGTWLNTPIAGADAANNAAMVASLTNTPTSMLSQIGNSITPLGAIGAGVGLLGGAYQLATSKGTGSTIGGISTMVGGAVSLIPGFGQIAGPIIAIGGNILGSLIGNGTPPTLNSYGTGTLNYGAGGFTTAGGTYGANAEQMGTTGALGQAGQGIAGIFNLLGGVKDPSRVYGLQLQSFRQDYGAGGTFQNQTSFIVGPNGEKMQWGQGSNDKDIGLSTAAGHIAVESIMGGAVGSISDNLRRALSNLSGQAAPTLDDIGKLVTSVKAFDDATKDFGKTISDATKQTTQALDQIDASFTQLYQTAAQYGLDTAPIDAQATRERQKFGQDFAYSVQQGILQITDPTTAALNDLAKERQALYDQDAVMVQRIEGYASQGAKIEEFYALKRKDIIEQANQQATAAMEQSLTGLNDLIKQLTYGSLSNASPITGLAGAKGTYAATLAQARAGDASALSSLSGVATDYLNASRTFYGSSTGYETARRQVLSDVSGLVSNTISTNPAANSNGALNSVLQRLAASQASQQTLTDEVNRLTGQVASLVAQLNRRAA